MQLLRIKRFWAFLLLPISLGLVSFAERHPDLTERVYSRGIYPVLTGLIGKFFSLFPFSVSQWLIFLAPLALLLYIIRQILFLVRDPHQRRERLAGLTATLACIAGAGYFLFLLLCGFNYHRESFTARSGLEVRPSSVEELANLCDELVGMANELRPALRENSDGVMVTGFDDPYGLADYAHSVSRSTDVGFDVPSGDSVRPKPVLFSRAMSYLDITGVYAPFTFEANINIDVPDFWIPSTMLHELAHAKGYMREDEANFLSYAACVASGNAEFQYSGVMLALTHSANALYAADRERYWTLYEAYCDGLKRDIDATAAYWKQFEGPVAEASSAVNDVYLRSNNQIDGVKSYGRMIDLLLADYRRRHGL